MEQRYDVTITDGAKAEHHRAVDYRDRNRLADFAFRHDLRVTVRPADARPERRTYR